MEITAQTTYLDREFEMGTQANIGAVWIQDSKGIFIKTLFVWGKTSLDLLQGECCITNFLSLLTLYMVYTQISLRYI